MEEEGGEGGGVRKWSESGGKSWVIYASPVAHYKRRGSDLRRTLWAQLGVEKRQQVKKEEQLKACYKCQEKK